MSVLELDAAFDELELVSVLLLEEQAAKRRLDARAKYKNFFMGHLSGNGIYSSIEIATGPPKSWPLGK